MPTAIVSACDANYAELQALTAPTIHGYAERHGYAALVSIYGETKRAPSWYKLVQIQEAFNQGYDTVLWVDTDAIIVNFSITVESLLRPGKTFYHSNNWYGMNCGVMILRDCIDVRRLLRAAWGQTHLIDHPWWEQAAIMALTSHGHFPADQIEEVPAAILNSEEYYGGCLVYHMPDTPLRERFKRFGRILSKENR